MFGHNELRQPLTDGAVAEAEPESKSNEYERLIARANEASPERVRLIELMMDRRLGELDIANAPSPLRSPNPAARVVPVVLMGLIGVAGLITYVTLSADCVTRADNAFSELEALADQEAPGPDIEEEIIKAALRGTALMPKCTLETGVTFGATLLALFVVLCLYSVCQKACNKITTLGRVCADSRLCCKRPPSGRGDTGEDSSINGAGVAANTSLQASDGGEGGALFGAF